MSSIGFVSRSALCRIIRVSSAVTLAVVIAVGGSGASARGDAAASAGGRDSENAGRSAVGHPLFLGPHFQPIVVVGQRVFVTNTPADTVDVLDARSLKLHRRIAVGVEPVALAVRPDGRELWVANHVSDSVSIIDIDPGRPTRWQVIDTVQEFDDRKATRFDEPVGIAFAGNDKAYVALSTDNVIAVIDVPSRRVVRRLKIPAQDPRAIAVRNGKLYVVPFESGNRTQLSGGRGDRIDGKLVTFDAWQHSIFNNNVLSLGHVVDIVKHPRVPDHDLFVFDTETDELIATVDGLGTLLYGIAVDSQGTAFIAQTDARNDANGRAGTKKHGIAELQNRAFLNRITRVPAEVLRRDRGKVASSLASSAGSAVATIARAATAATAEASRDADAAGEGAVEREPRPARGVARGAAARDVAAGGIGFIDLEPLPPRDPKPEEALATPYGIAITPDDRLIVVTAAGSDRLFVVEAASGRILGRVDVDAAPRGVALAAADSGELIAYVYGAAANSVVAVSLADPARPHVRGRAALPDPTPAVLKRGRAAFETARASTTETFGCASCHPDGHTDQLLWVLDTPIVTGGNQIMPRSTMPIRGLRDTEPYHWDGTLGDPYGGINSASLRKPVPPNCEEGRQETCARQLIDESLRTITRRVDDPAVNDEGKPGRLSAADRDALARFILSIPYPPAQRRPYTNVVTDRARRGFELFHVEGDLDPSKPRANVCGNCHRMPFWVSTNTPGTGMDAPTWRGAYDRFLILPQGRLNIIDFDFYRRVADQGFDERQIWRFSWGGRQRFDPVWDMVLEGSTGFPGAFARQVTLNRRTADDPQTADLLAALERAAAEQSIVLQGEGVLLEDATPSAMALEFRDGRYLVFGDASDGFGRGLPAELSREQLRQRARNGTLLVTLTGRIGPEVYGDTPQPAVWTRTHIARQSGRQPFPVLRPGERTMVFRARHVGDDALIFVDGRRVSGTLKLKRRSVDLDVTLELDNPPAEGMHLLQLQNPRGLVSNDFIFFVRDEENTAGGADARKDRPAAEPERRTGRSQSLQELLREHGWETLIGTWIDRGSRGRGLKQTYAWKVPGRVIEHESFEPGKRTTALIFRDASTGDVVSVGADSQGGSYLARWRFEKGEAVLEAAYVTPDGVRGQIRVRQKLLEKDHMRVTVDLPEPIVIDLVRVPEREGAR